MIRVNVGVAVDALSARLGATAKESRKAAAAALNRTAGRVRTYSARGIRDAGYNIKIGEIKRSMRIGRASQFALAATVTASGRPIPLIKYGARQTGSGVTVNVMRGRRTIRHAFVARMPSGHEGVFIQRKWLRGSGVGGGVRSRTRSAGGLGRKHGLPINELYGPGIPQAFANKLVRKVMVEQTNEYFPLEMARQLGFQISKR